MSVPGLHWLLALLLLWSFAALSSAAPPGGAQDSTSAPAAADLERLRERAAAFWAARVAGDTKGQWELLEPRGRNRLTPADYGPRPGVVKYLAYQVEDATVNGYFATVQVRLLVQITPPTQRQPRKRGPSGFLVSDRWVRVGGVWYRSLEQENEEPVHRSDE